MASSAQRKKDFATRLSPRTLERLYTLVGQGRFKNRTEIIEAAVDRLFDAESRDPERLRRAFERACGALNLGIDRAAWQRAEIDRLEWEATKHTGGKSGRR